MNIAVYSHYFTPEIGAPSARIHDMARQWLSSGHKVDVVTCYPNHPIGTLYPGYGRGRYMTEMLDGIRVHRNWTYITPNKGFLKKTLGHISFLPSAAWSSSGQVTKPHVTIGTSPTFFAAMAAGRLGKRHHIPFIMEIRDLWPAAVLALGVIKNRFLIKLLEGWELSLYKRAAHIVTVTDGFRQNLISRGVNEGKITNIPNGADVEFWKPEPLSTEPVQEAKSGGKFVVLYVGAHGVSQALHSILDTAQLLRERPEIHFLLVGEGAQKEQLISRARELGLKNVEFREPTDKSGVKALYTSANACLVPLRNIAIFDTFIPSKMFEIMAMGRPIIGSLRGEAAAILNSSGGALVCSPEDSRGIADAILHLYQCPSKWVQMGRQARAFVVENYSRKTFASRYESLMRQVVEKWSER